MCRALRFLCSAGRQRRVAPRQRFFPDAAQAAAFLPGFLETGDLVLLKGSRGVRLERVVEALLTAGPVVGEEQSRASVDAPGAQAGRH